MDISFTQVTFVNSYLIVPVCPFLVLLFFPKYQSHSSSNVLVSVDCPIISIMSEIRLLLFDKWFLSIDSAKDYVCINNMGYIFSDMYLVL